MNQRLATKVLLSRALAPAAALTGGLRTFLGTDIKDRLGRTPVGVVLHLGEHGLSAKAKGGHRRQDIEAIWNASADEWSPPDAPARFSSVARHRIVQLQVPRAMVLEQEVVLPQAAAANLDGAVSFGISTWSPFSPADVYVASKIKALKGAQVTVTVRYALKSRIDPIIELCRTAGLAPDRLSFDEAVLWTVPLNRGRLASLRLSRRIDGSLMATLGLLVVLLGGIVLERQSKELEALQLALRENLAALRHDEQAERSLQEIEARHTIVARRRATEAGVADVLSAIGNALPPNASLVSVDLSLRQGRLEIEGAPAGEILQTIRSVELIEDVKIDASPVGGPTAIVFTLGEMQR